MNKTSLALFIALGMVNFSPSVIAADTPAAVEKISRGLLLQHAGKLIFSPCHERTYVQVKDNSPDNQISQALQNLGLTDKTPLYVEFLGTAEADTLKVTWLNFANTNSRCQGQVAPDIQWYAMGDTENWFMRISKAGLWLSQEGHPAIKHEQIELTAKDEEITVQTEAAGAGQWTLSRQLCRTSDKTRLFGWLARGQDGKNSLHGCAWQGY